MYELTNLAIDTAQKIGVQYADVRIANYRQQILATEDHRVSQISGDSLVVMTLVLKKFSGLLI